MAEYSPMMQKYLETKKQYSDCILFYRLGDFYEMFFEDAIIVSKELDLTLTGKLCGAEEKAPMAGVPHHAAEVYITKLIEKGYKVAICEQLTDPKETKGIVERGVVKVVTPGTVIDTGMLEEKSNNYIMSVYKSGIYYGLAISDISTGELYATQIKEDNNFSRLLDEIAKYMPQELILNTSLFENEEQIKIIRDRFNSYITKYDEKNFVNDSSKIIEKYTISESIEQKPLIISSLNGLTRYLDETQKTNLAHINLVKIYSTSKYMALDINARRNLELVERMRDKSKRGTLLWVLDKTSTSMGAREIKRWINTPLIEKQDINKRLDAIEEIKNNLMLKGELITALKKIYDIERLAGKMAYGNSNARDMITLKNSLERIPEVKAILSLCDTELLKEIYQNLDTLEDIYELLEKSIEEDPPITIKDGDIIKLGYNPEIDEFKKAKTQGQEWLMRLEAEEKEKTNIKTLKVGYNKVFGYFIEVSKSFINEVPDRFIRKQTLSTGERYITEELKVLEEKILGAGEKVVKLEYEEFVKIRQEVAKNIIRIQKTSNNISNLDAIVSLAIVAEDLNYIKPNINTEGIIDIKEGRHPVIEKMLGIGEFIENDTYMDKEENRLNIITGPNMAGKSTYMRQIALITLMAQIGSFVPAKSANIGIVDKIFTRVGASDDLSMGQSTFMVEMMEVANILREATQNSLVILDEIGRGTSTYDGLSIAWAVAEYISKKDKCGAKTVFATHYHELIKLEEKMEGIKNYSVAVKEKGDSIEFLRKIVKGGTDDSYGIHVAKLAGVPTNVTTRANQILKSLEKKDIMTGKIKQTKGELSGQLDMFNYKIAEVSSEIDKIDINTLTPMEALNTIYRIKEKIK